MTIQWGQSILYCKPCDFTKSIKCKKPYVVEGTNNGSVATRGDITFGGREIRNVHRHLEGVNKRPLGLASSQRVQDTLCVSTQPKHTANSTSISFRTGSSNKRRGQAATGEGSSDSGTRQSRWLLFKPLLSTQEEWPNETSDQPETVERVGVHRTLQNGGNPNPEGHSTIRRLVCESRSERCLLHNPNRLQPPAVPEVHAGRGELSVHMPPLCPVLCPPCVHQGIEASDDATPFMGGQDNCLYRRYANSGGDSRASVTTPRDPHVDTTGLGVHCQSRQICAQTNPSDRVPGSGCQLSVNGDQPPRGEAETNQRRRYKTPLPITGVSQTSVSVHRETKRSRSSCGSSSPVLPPPAGQLEKRPCLWQPWLREFNNSIPANPGGAELVEAAPSDMEWQVPDQRQGANSYLLRCLPPGMGSNMQWDTNRRSVVQTGKDMAHQLPGVASSFSGSSDIPEGQVRDLCATAVGQHHCSGLHQQSGGDSVPTTDQSGKVSVVMGLAERYLIDSPTHTSSVQSGSRYRVQNNEGSDRLETQSCSFQPDQPNIWAPGSGPVCIQADLPTFSLFQLETRPISRGNGCLSTALGTPERVCQSSLVPIGRVLNQVMIQKAQVILVAPIWKGQPWYPVLLNMLWEFPRRIPPHPNLIQSPVELDLPRLIPQLAVSPISGKSSVVAAFQKRLQDCSWPPGEPSQINPMTHTSGNDQLVF